MLAIPAPGSRRLALPAALLTLALLSCAPPASGLGRVTLTSPASSPSASLVVSPAAVAPAAAPQAAPPATGRLVEAPRNIRAFSPEDSAASAVDAWNLSLRSVFEELGTDASTWYQHVQTLSDPYFEGRAGGTKGFERATDYLAFHYERLGLEPAFPPANAAAGAAWTSYAQPFTYPGRPRRSYHLLEARFSFADRELGHEKDFAVLAPSGGETVTAPVTFVGYGLEEGEDGYTSFDEDTSLEGRIALVLRYEPIGPDGRSQWSERRWSPYASLSGKLGAIADRGAAGIILVNPLGAVDGGTGLESLESSGRFGRPLEIPVIQALPEVVDDLLAHADPDGRDLVTLQNLANAGEIRAVDLAEDARVTVGGQVEIEVERREFDSANAAGVLRGRGRLADEWVVVGGHYDHVGYGSAGAMPGGAGRLHPGADDNASGTAGILITAQRLAKTYEETPADADLRSILFIGFGAEEVGLLGSAHYVAHPTIPLERVSLMVNMDMIGRLRNDELMVGGSGTATEFDEILQTYGAASGLTLALSPGGRGPSDHSNFFGKDIPVLFFFTGLHESYHRPGDLGYTVNPAGAIRILDLIEMIVTDVVARPRMLTFQSSSDVAARGGPSRTGARVRLGIMPSYSAELETGILVDGVGEGTSAAEAGVQSGDVLITWNGEELTGGQRLAELLRASQPGDKVTLGVLRDGKKMELKLTLQARESSE